MPKELRKLCPILKDQDWSYERSARGHIAFADDSGRVVYHASGTPSDHRALKNLLAGLRRSGLQVPADFRLG